MSVQLRCTKCNGVLENPGGGNILYCPNCKKTVSPDSGVRSLEPDPTHEERVESLLTDILYELQKLNGP
jgi:hypothetical protein